MHPSAHAFLLPSVGQRYACCRRSTFHVCFSYTFFLFTLWRFPVAQNLCFTSCYNETVYKQNTSLPFWHRFDVSDQDEKCLDISRFKWWMAIIVRSWKQGLQSPLGLARVHPGSRGSSILYTNLNTFKEVVIHVSECTETSCKAMHRVFPTDPGKTVKLCNEKVS